MTFFQGFLGIILYITLVLSIMQNYVILGVVVLCVFTFKYSAIALLPLAVILDGYYGAFFTLPLFSISAVIWYVLSEALRARMSVVQSQYE